MELYSAKDMSNLLVVWRDSSMVKSIHCSQRELRFTSQQPCGGLQLSIIPIPLDWMPPLASACFCMHMVHINLDIHMYRYKF